MFVALDVAAGGAEGERLHFAVAVEVHFHGRAVSQRVLGKRVGRLRGGGERQKDGQQEYAQCFHRHHLSVETPARGKKFQRTQKARAATGPSARGADKVGRRSERRGSPQPQKSPPISFYQGDLRGLWALSALCGSIRWPRRGWGPAAWCSCRPRGGKTPVGVEDVIIGDGDDLALVVAQHRRLALGGEAELVCGSASCPEA